MEHGFVFSLSISHGFHETTIAKLQYNYQCVTIKRNLALYVKTQEPPVGDREQIIRRISRDSINCTQTKSVVCSALRTLYIFEQTSEKRHSSAEVFANACEWTPSSSEVLNSARVPNQRQLGYNARFNAVCTLTR